MATLTTKGLLFLIPDAVEWKSTVWLHEQAEERYGFTSIGKLHVLLRSMEDDELIESKSVPDTEGKRNVRPAKHVRLTAKGVSERQSPTYLTLPRKRKVSVGNWSAAVLTVMALIVNGNELARIQANHGSAQTFLLWFMLGGLASGLLASFGLHEWIGLLIMAFFLLAGMTGDPFAMSSFGSYGIQELNISMGMGFGVLLGAAIKLVRTRSA